MLEWIAGKMMNAGIFGIILLSIFSLAWLIAYFLISAGLSGLARKRGITNYGVAWIPVARYYLLGKVLRDELVVTPKIRIPYFQIILPLLNLIALFDTVMSGLFFLAFLVLRVIAFISLFRLYQDQNAIARGFFAGLPLLEAVGGVLIYSLSDQPAPDSDQDATAFP